MTDTTTTTDADRTLAEAMARLATAALDAGTDTDHWTAELAKHNAALGLPADHRHAPKPRAARTREQAQRAWQDGLAMREADGWD